MKLKFWHYTIIPNLFYRSILFACIFAPDLKSLLLDFTGDLDECLRILHGGGLILYPTDTIWGIGCDATNEAAVQRIMQLKKRAESKSLIVLMADAREVLKYVSQPDLRVFDFLQTVQKPTTVIYEGGIGLAGSAINTDGTVAIRVVKELFCRHLVKRFRKPVISTSANISGDPSPAFFNQVGDEIKNGVDYIVQYRQQETETREASAIVRWNKDATVTIIRS